MNRKELALKHLSFPLKYDDHGQVILDADGNHLLDVRGWGRLQYLPNGRYIQDAIGVFVAQSLNQAVALEAENARLIEACKMALQYFEDSPDPMDREQRLAERNLNVLLQEVVNTTQ